MSSDSLSLAIYTVLILDIRSVRFTETTEPGDKTAVHFTRVFNNDVINKNTAVRFTWFQPGFQNSFETFENTSRGSFYVRVLSFLHKIRRGLFESEIIFVIRVFEHCSN